MGNVQRGRSWSDAVGNAKREALAQRLGGIDELGEVGTCEQDISEVLGNVDRTAV